MITLQKSPIIVAGQRRSGKSTAMFELICNALSKPDSKHLLVVFGKGMAEVYLEWFSKTIGGYTKLGHPTITVAKHGGGELRIIYGTGHLLDKPLRGLGRFDTLFIDDADYIDFPYTDEFVFDWLADRVIKTQTINQESNSNDTE